MARKPSSLLTKATQLGLRIYTVGKPAWLPEFAPVPFPSSHQVWTLKKAGLACILPGVAKAYIEVFAQEPWNESHLPERVIEKLQRELAAPQSLLVTLRGNKNWPVAGFCWGAVLTPQEIYQRILLARSVAGKTRQNLADVLLATGRLDPRLLFIDEIAILPQFRGGLSPIQFLIRPIFEMGYQGEVKQALFWTRSDSPIYPLALAMGFEIIGQMDEVVFIFLPDLAPLLKILQNVEPEKIRTILSIASGSWVIKFWRRWRRKLLKRALQISKAS